MKAILIAAMLATLVWAPWQLVSSDRNYHSPTVHNPIWEPPPSSRLRVEVLAAEWVGVLIIWGIAMRGSRREKEARFDAEGNVIE